MEARKITSNFRYILSFLLKVCSIRAGKDTVLPIFDLFSSIIKSLLFIFIGGLTLSFPNVFKSTLRIHWLLMEFRSYDFKCSEPNNLVLRTTLPFFSREVLGSQQQSVDSIEISPTPQDPTYTWPPTLSTSPMRAVHLLQSMNLH